MTQYQRHLLILVMVLAWPAASIAAVSATSIVNSPHNLSASGPGAIKSATETEVCIFCHTPHKAAAIQPLWNRNMPANAYVVYSSSSLVSKPGQPTGSSKLCLSCHDGTIALGSVLSRGSPIQMANGVNSLPPGVTNLGTNLSGDHPISFTFDSRLAVTSGKLRDPSGLPSQVQLDNHKQLQCTSCHDPHNDSRGKFLVMDNSNSQLCNSCHLLSTTAPITGHNQCTYCHQQHNSSSKSHILAKGTVDQTCLTCHGSSSAAGSTALSGTDGQSSALSAAALAPNTSVAALSAIAPNIASDLQKFSNHNDENPIGVMTLGGSSSTSSTSQATCADCHEPHTISTGSAVAPNVSPALGQVSGLTASGAVVTTAKYGYEVCFKCHSGQDRPTISRSAIQTNISAQFNITAVSFHPVVAAGRGHDVPSLDPSLTTSSIIGCCDCHNSENSRTAGGGGPNGPHGSNFSPLLIANYDMIDGTSESAVAYALCYRCHQRTSILNNESFSSHSLHVVNQRTPCSVCHDSHGISSTTGTTTNNAHLINFDTSIVQPDPITKRLQYQSMGYRTGRCYLLCHGKIHSGTKYP